MIRAFLITSLLLISIQARENPFFPSQGEKDIPYSSNQTKEIPELKRATISLPSHARVLKKVTIEYENLDASVESKSIELDNSVDWHLPIFISQSYAEQPTQKKQVKIQKKEKTVASKKSESFTKIAEIKYANFHVSNKNMKILTKDKLLRNFLLVQPHRIVMDFQKENSMKSYLKKIKDSVFTKIRIGNHKGYYRVVVELDGYYRYSMKKIPEGYLITLK